MTLFWGIFLPFVVGCLLLLALQLENHVLVFTLGLYGLNGPGAPGAPGAPIVISFGRKKLITIDWC